MVGGTLARLGIDRGLILELVLLVQTTNMSGELQ
jgi:hypothetical protein